MSALVIGASIHFQPMKNARLTILFAFLLSTFNLSGQNKLVIYFNTNCASLNAMEEIKLNEFVRNLDCEQCSLTPSANTDDVGTKNCNQG
jgi:hypothetical protein